MATLKIDDNMLQEIGLGSLPVEEKRGLLGHIYETLEMRVGMRLADQMTNEQLDEFEQYFEAKDDAGAFKWLESNFPNYKDIVNEEFEKLKGEVAQNAPQILAAAQQNALNLQGQMTTPPQQPGGQPQYQQPTQQYGPAPQQPQYQQPQPQYAPQQPQPGQGYGQPQPYQQQPQPQYQPQPYNPGPQPQAQPGAWQQPAPQPYQQPQQPAPYPNQPGPAPQQPSDDNQSQPPAGPQPTAQ